jgi:hypothetical protein
VKNGGGVDCNDWIMHEHERMTRTGSEFEALSISGVGENIWYTHEHGCEYMTCSARCLVSLRTFVHGWSIQEHEHEHTTNEVHDVN